MASVRLVICTHNRSDSLAHALDCLAQCEKELAEAIPVLVVANACIDNTLQMLTRGALWPTLDIRVIVEPVAGKSFALNRAIAETADAALCFVDDDQCVEPGFWSALGRGLKDYPEADIFCGRLWPAWDGAEPQWVHEEGQYRIPIRPFPEYDLGETERFLDPDERMPSGGNLVVRRRVFETAGHFSTDFGPRGHDLEGGEDHEFLKRAVRDGASIVYLPLMRQRHAVDPHRMSTGYMLRKAYNRSRASARMRATPQRLRPYHLSKMVSLLWRALITFAPQKRFFFLIRLASHLGETSALLEAPRQSSKRLPDRKKTQGT